MSNIRISQFCIGLALCAAATPALAEWTGKGDVGASFASGNTENEVANANLELKNTLDKWQHTMGFAGNYGSDSRRQDRAALGSSRPVRVQVHRTRLRLRRRALRGRPLQRSTTSRRRSRAVSATRSSTPSAPSSGCRAAPVTAMPEFNETGESEDGVIFRGDLGFDHQLTETTKIVERFLVEAGSDNTYLQNDLGLEVTISGALACGSATRFATTPTCARPSKRPIR